VTEQWQSDRVTRVRMGMGGGAEGLMLVSPAPISAALRGMGFIEAMVHSSQAGQSWVEVGD